MATFPSPGRSSGIGSQPHPAWIGGFSGCSGFGGRQLVTSESSDDYGWQRMERKGGSSDPAEDGLDSRVTGDQNVTLREPWAERQ